MAGLVSGGERAVNLAGAHGIDQHALATHESRIARLEHAFWAKRIASNGSAGGSADDRGVVDVDGRAELAGERGDRLARDLC